MFIWKYGKKKCGDFWKTISIACLDMNLNSLNRLANVDTCVAFFFSFLVEWYFSAHKQFVIYIQSLVALRNLSTS